MLALPFSTLRLARPHKLPLPKTKRQAIAELGYGTHTKLIGAFRGRPWQTVANKTGAVFTDNGLQYVWETSTGQRGSTGVLHQLPRRQGRHRSRQRHRRKRSSGAPCRCSTRSSRAPRPST